MHIENESIWVMRGEPGTSVQVREVSEKGDTVKYEVVSADGAQFSTGKSAFLSKYIPLEESSLETMLKKCTLAQE